MKKGFTLVELLIVLAVIAALMAVATPMALNAVKQAKASQVAQNLNALKSAVENYVAMEHSLPTDTSNKLSVNALKSYLSSIPSGYKLYPNTANPTFDSNGQLRIYVVYEDADVSVTDAKKQNPAVYAYDTIKPDASPTLDTTVTKFW